MRPIRGTLASLGSLLLLSTLAAQEFPQSTPQPTRWTGQATTIDAASTTQSGSTFPASPTIQSGSNDPAFPPLVHRQAEGAAGLPAAESESNMLRPTVTITSSLAVVLGLFAALVWITRRFGSRSMNQSALPKEVLQSLGTSPIDARTRVTMLRVGNRILVVAQTATGIQPLSEITDPEEVRQLSASCLGEASRSFGSTLQSFEQEPVAREFTGSSETPVAPQRRSRLFASA